MSHDPMKHFERWAHLAREEKPAGTSVETAVIARLREARETDRPRLWFAVASAAAAVVVIAFALPTLQAVMDPLGIWIHGARFLVM